MSFRIALAIPKSVLLSDDDFGERIRRAFWKDGMKGEEIFDAERLDTGQTVMFPTLVIFRQLILEHNPGGHFWIPVPEDCIDFVRKGDKLPPNNVIRRAVFEESGYRRNGWNDREGHITQIIYTLKGIEG